MLKLKIPYAHWPAVSKILSVLQKAEEEKKNVAQRKERQTSQSVCLFTENGSRNILPLCTVIWEAGSHKHMLNDSIHSLRHYLFISASHSLFSLMDLPICTPQCFTSLAFSILNLGAQG